MDFNFLASMDRITNAYLNQNASNRIDSESIGISDEAKKSFGAEFSEAYDSLQATRMLNDSLRDSYDFNHKDDLRQHAQRLGYSIDNRIIDMLNIKLSDDMNMKVNSSLNNAMNELLQN